MILDGKELDKPTVAQLLLNEQEKAANTQPESEEESNDPPADCAEDNEQPEEN